MALYQPESRSREVLAATDDLIARGLRIGTPVREAEARWPNAIYRPLDIPVATAAFEPILGMLDSFSPIVEGAGPGIAFLDATGLDLLYGADDALAGRLRTAVAEYMDERYAAPDTPIGVGVAGGKYVAEVAARIAATDSVPRVVAPGGDRDFLAPLPIDVLPLGADARRHLRLLGLRTVGEVVAHLPRNAVGHRLGDEGLRAWCIAAGEIVDDELDARPQPLVLADRIELEWAEENLDRLTFLLKGLADRLAMRLGRSGLAASQLRVTWHLGRPIDAGDDVPETRVAQLVLAEPSASSAALLEILRWHVEALRLPGPVVAIEIAADDLTPPGGRQLRLLGGQLGRPASFERRRNARRGIARLRARWGPIAVRRAAPRMARRPERTFDWLPPERDLDAFEDVAPSTIEALRSARAAIEAQPPLWLIDPPTPVRVLIGRRRGRAPVLVYRRRRIRLRQWAGPFRVVDLPWMVDGADRDYYQVVGDDEHAYWLYRDRTIGRWLCQARYD